MVGWPHVSAAAIRTSSWTSHAIDRDSDTLHTAGAALAHVTWPCAIPPERSPALAAWWPLSAVEATQVFAKSEVRDFPDHLAHADPSGRALRELGQTSARAGVLAGGGGQRRGTSEAHLGAAAASVFGQDTVVEFPGPAREHAFHLLRTGKRGASEPSRPHRFGYSEGRPCGQLVAPASWRVSRSLRRWMNQEAFGVYVR